MIDGVALSTLDWWTEAGVDTLVDELPRNWLAVPTTPPGEAAEARPAPASLPATIEALRAWLLTDAAIGGAAGQRVDAMGDHRHGTVIVVDMPEAEDRAAGTLLSGEVGALFDRMLTAIALSRAEIYLIPFSPARPTAGRLSEREQAVLAPLLLHHLMLAAPRRLLLMGDAPVQALLRLPAAKARDIVHQVTIGEAQVPTVASLPPRLIQGKYRALAWGDLQRFAAL